MYSEELGVGYPKLSGILANLELIPSSDGNRDFVVIGSVVTVREDGGRPETFRLVGAVEANPREGRISTGRHWVTR